MYSSWNLPRIELVLVWGSSRYSIVYLSCVYLYLLFIYFRTYATDVILRLKAEESRSFATLRMTGNA